MLDIHLKENMARIATRRISTGRFTNLGIVQSSYGINKKVFDRLKEAVDGWANYDNNGKEAAITDQKNWILGDKK